MTFCIFPCSSPIQYESVHPFKCLDFFCLPPENSFVRMCKQNIVNLNRWPKTPIHQMLISIIEINNQRILFFTRCLVVLIGCCWCSFKYIQLLLIKQWLFEVCILWITWICFAEKHLNVKHQQKRNGKSHFTIQGNLTIVFTSSTILRNINNGLADFVKPRCLPDFVWHLTPFAFSHSLTRFQL